MVAVLGINEILACLTRNVRGFYHQIGAISLCNKYFSNQMCELFLEEHSFTADQFFPDIQMVKGRILHFSQLIL